MLLRPHSTTAAHSTAPALAPRAARGDPLVDRAAGLGHARAAATAGETAEQDFLSGLRGSQDRQDFGGGPGAGGLLDALAPHSNTTAPTGLLQLWPRALFVPALCVPRLFHVVPLSVVLL